MNPIAVVHLALLLRDAEPPSPLRLSGELDIAAADRTVALLTAADWPVVEVDLREVTFIDACGIGALLRAKRVIEADGRRLVLAGARGMVRQVFEIVELESLLEE